MERLIIGIIGAGPAGMMAALHAAGCGGQILLFEGNQVIGRKLAVTGNGRCNITNSRIDPRRYVCADSGFITQVLEQFSHEHLAAFLDGMALPLLAKEDGWCYPRSESAIAVVDAFAAALQQAGVELLLGEKVISFGRSQGGWRISASRDYRVDRLIIAAGGQAQPQLGSRGELFPYLKQHGHTVLPSRPALAPIMADMRRLHKLQGVRMDAGLELWQDEVLLGQSTGNTIFSQRGLNGPAAMDLSHLVSGQGEGNLTLRVNFISGEEMIMDELFKRYAKTAWPAGVVLSGLLLPKVARFVLQSAGLATEVTMHDLDEPAVHRLWQQLTGTQIRVHGTGGLETAQVSAGGVPVTEVEAMEMASKRAAGLYLVGEVLDVVGPCGGYNLQFAFSSGALAGQAAAR